MNILLLPIHFFPLRNCYPSYKYTVYLETKKREVNIQGGGKKQCNMFIINNIYTVSNLWNTIFPQIILLEWLKELKRDYLIDLTLFYKSVETVNSYNYLLSAHFSVKG